jgi:hypothetical protein
MITDEKLGLKIAENEDEAMWATQVKALENEQEQLKKLLKINLAMLEKSKEELEKAKGKV